MTPAASVNAYSSSGCSTSDLLHTAQPGKVAKDGPSTCVPTIRGENLNESPGVLLKLG